MSNEATTMAEAMERKHSEPATPAPSALEIEAYALTLKNGIELGLGKQDPGIAIAAKLQAQYPHHLVLLQDGAFLHAYGKSAYFFARTQEVQANGRWSRERAQYPLRLAGCGA